eukprot:260497-Prymnesium_polylepis.2
MVSRNCTSREGVLDPTTRAWVTDPERNEERAVPEWAAAPPQKPAPPIPVELTATHGLAADA